MGSNMNWIDEKIGIVTAVAKDLVQQLRAPSADVERRVSSPAAETFKKVWQSPKLLKWNKRAYCLFKANLVKIDNCQSVVWRTDEIFKTNDVTVNVALVTDSGDIINTSSKLFDEIMTVNILALFFLSQEASNWWSARATKEQYLMSDLPVRWKGSHLYRRITPRKLHW